MQTLLTRHLVALPAKNFRRKIYVKKHKAGFRARCDYLRDRCSVRAKQNAEAWKSPKGIHWAAVLVAGTAESSQI
jgi:hypothetical protein